MLVRWFIIAECQNFYNMELFAGYMTLDAFTSNWQNELFKVHKMSPYQMMCGVNFFSVILTSSSLLQQGTFYISLVFMSHFPAFVFDCVLLSLCSALGQVFKFNKTKFLTMMTRNYMKL